MEEMGVKSCGDLRKFSLDALQKEFGVTSGKTFYDYCRGIDHDEVRTMQPRRSIGAEVSWGVRFGDEHRQQLIDFISAVAAEVARRCETAGGIPSKVTLKVYKKKPDSGPSGKVRARHFGFRYLFPVLLKYVYSFSNTRLSSKFGAVSWPWSVRYC